MSSSTSQKPAPKPQAKLKRSLDLKDAVLFGVGVMLGAGIYAIIGEAAGLAGNALWASFLLAACVTFLTALSYAEFVSRFPDAGGSFEYIKQALGSRTAYLAGILIFFTGIVAAAAIAISFAQYFARVLVVPGWSVPDQAMVIAVLLAMGLVNVIGVKSSSGFNMVATFVTVAGLLLVIGFAIPDWGSADLLATSPDGWLGVTGAAALVFFSYVGFEDLVKMAEETKEPRKTLPKALMISAVAVLLIYLAVAVSAVSVLDWNRLSRAGGPLSAVIETKLGRWGAFSLAVVALFATSKTILSNILGTSRLLFDIARDSDATWLRRLTWIPEKLGTPVWAIVLVVSLAIAFSLIGDLGTVASISNSFVMTVFTLVNIALIVWRSRHPEAEKAPFHLPGRIGRIPILPAAGAIATLVLFGFNIANITGTW